MKKLLLSAAVSAAVLSGTAHAVISEDASGKPIFSSANTYEVYLSGASAPRQFIESYLTAPTAGAGSVPNADRLCTGKVYKFAGTTSNNNYNAYLCEINNTTNVPAYNALKGVGGKVNVLVHKRSAGGSAQGVSPVIADSAIDFLDVSGSLSPTIPAACTVASTSANLNVISCPTPAAGANTQIPDFGVSDVDPAQFKGSNTPIGFAPVTPAGLAQLTVRPAFAQIFGIPVSLKLRNALQQIQFPVTNHCNPLHADYLYNGPLPVPAGKDSSATIAGYQPWSENAACVPTMTKGDVASILTGKITSGKQLFVGANNLYNYISTNNPSLLPGDPSIHICSRVNGSGTKATTDLKFLNYPCATAATQAVQDTGGLDPVANAFIDFALFGFTPEAPGQPQVHQNSSGGDVNECFNELNAGTSNATGNFRNNPFAGARWAIGNQGTDNNAALGNAYRFVKINNVLPLGSQVVTDNFGIWVESTYQFNTSHVYDAGDATIRDMVISKTGLPSVVSIINKSGAGYGSYDPVAGTFIAGVGQASHSWATPTILSGFLATPSNPAVTTTATGQYSATSPINPLSHDTTAAGAVIDNCRAPALYTPSASFNKGLQLK